MKKIVLAGVVLALAVGCALAQTPAAPVVIDTRPLVEQLVPYIIAVAGSVITVLGTLAVGAINKWGRAHGLQIDDSNRDALLASLRNGASGLIAAGAVRVEANGKINVSPGLVSSLAKDIVENRAPDAVQHFGLTPDQVGQKIVEQMPQILAAPATPAPKAA